jgi:hypothetical protein
MNPILELDYDAILANRGLESISTSHDYCLQLTTEENYAGSGP